MTAAEPQAQVSRTSLGVFERWLTLWVALCIAAGIGLGQAFPAPFQWLGQMAVLRASTCPLGC